MSMFIFLSIYSGATISYTLYKYLKNIRNIRRKKTWTVRHNKEISLRFLMIYFLSKTVFYDIYIIL